MSNMYKERYSEGYTSPKSSKMGWHLVMLLISALLMSSNVFAQMCPDLNCTSNDVMVKRVYLGDANGNALTSACTPGNPVQAYLYLVLSTNTPRVGVQITGTLKIEGMADQAVSNCFGVQLTGESNILKYPNPVNWTCGSKIMLVDIFVAWGTGNTNFCESQPSCSSIVPSKCRREVPIIVEAPLIAKFTYETSCTENNKFETVTVTSTTTGGKMPYTYAWDFNNDGVTDATSQTASYTYMSDGEKSVKLTVKDASDPNMMDSHTSMVMINSCCTTPEANAGPDKTLTCATTSVALSGSTSAEGATYAWVASNGGHIVSGENTLTPTVDAAGTYTLTVTTATGGCSASDEVAVTENKAVNANAGEDKILNCNSASVKLSGSSSTEGATYAWVAANGGNIVSGANTLTPTVDAAGTYTLTVTNPNNGCETSDEVAVTMDMAAPDAEATGGMLSCDTHSLQLKGSSSTAGATYSWTGPDGFTSEQQNPTVTMEGTYTLTVKNPANGCTVTADAEVEPQPLPEPEITCHLENYSDEEKGLVTVLNTPAGPVPVFGKKRNPDGSYAPENHAAIFDTQAPTGDDTDLYTVDWHHVLIINQDQTNVPNDNQWGGELHLNFSEIGPVTMTSMKALDIDGYENNSWVYLYGANDVELYKVKLEALGNNSRQTVNLGNTKGVMKMKIVLDGRDGSLNLAGSGAFDDLSFCIEKEVENPCNVIPPLGAATEAQAVAYPMPFSDRTTLEFAFEKAGKYVANLYDLRGNLLKELKSGHTEAGETTSVEIDGRNMINGIYLARIVNGTQVKTVKLILRK